MMFLSLHYAFIRLIHVQTICFGYSYISKSFVAIAIRKRKNQDVQKFKKLCMYHHKNYGGLNYVKWSFLAAGHHQVLGDFSGDSGGLHGGLTQPVLVLPQTSPGEGRVHEEQHHCTSRRGLWNVRLIDNSTV